MPGKILILLALAVRPAFAGTPSANEVATTLRAAASSTVWSSVPSSGWNGDA